MAVNTTPIKRSKELTPLSREHHDGLLLCWKINEGIKRSIPAGRIGTYVLDFFDKYLVGHFEEEERFIFPLLSFDNSDRIEAELHHKMLREMISSFRVEHQITYPSLQHYAEILDKHIRYEERVLFPLIEKEVTTESLQLATSKLTTDRTPGTEWEDQFWINKK